MHIKKTVTLGMSLLTLILFFSCNENKKINIQTKEIFRKEDALKSQIKLIKNKSITSLNKILGDSIDIGNKVILLYNGFDCDSCIDIGFEMAKKIDSIGNKQIVYIISNSSNVGRDQLKNNYLRYVYNDEHDLIRRDLKFIYTPVFISLNSKNKINNVFYPSYNRNIDLENKFTEECINNFKDKGNISKNKS